MNSYKNSINIQNHEIKRVQLDALNFLISFLDKHQIKYFVIAGTLLGAVRHRGFIPWDDDIDIGLKRNDYEQFIDLFSKEFNSDPSKLYFLQNWHTEKEFAMPFSKLRVNQTIYKEFVTKNINFHHGIYIDIFPFDDVKTNKIQNKLQNNVSNFIHKIILLKSNYKIISPKIQIFLRGILRILPKKSLINIFEKFTCSSDLNSQHMVCTGGSYGFYRETVNKYWFKELEVFEFENLKVKGPIKFNLYLQNLYGDYMILPPVEERISRHGIVEINLYSE